MEKINIALAQIAAKDAGNQLELDDNLNSFIKHMKMAKLKNPDLDIFVTAECSFQGVHGEEWLNMLTTLDSPEIKKIATACKENNIWGVFNPWVKPSNGDFCYNTIIIINNKGEIVHEYIKMNPWAPMETCNPGMEMPICRGPKGSRIATILSSDGEYPEMWKLIKEKDANLIIRSSHYMHPFNQAYEITNKGMAIVAKAYVVGCNPVGKDGEYYYMGNSMIVDPKGQVVNKAPMGVPAIVHGTLYI